MTKQELKAQAWDLIARLEALNEQIRATQKELQAINEQIHAPDEETK